MSERGDTATWNQIRCRPDALKDSPLEQILGKTGWDRTASSEVTLSFVDGTRTFTVTPTGASFSYWINGVEYTKTSAESVVITDTGGAWFIYYLGDTLTASQTPWGFDGTKAFLSTLYWDAANNEHFQLLPEWHSWEMPEATHKYLHETFKTRWEEGLAVTLDGTTGIDVTAGEIHDEDIEASITDDVGSGLWDQTLSPAECPILYRSGASGLWRQIAPTAVPVYLDTNILQYNEWTGATWQLSPISNNKYCAYWVIASTALNEEGVFIVPGQEEGDNLNAARDGNALADMSFGSLPTAEHKVLARFLVKRIAGAPYYELAEIADYRNAVDEPTGSGPAVVDSVFGRTGTVVALSGDYDADEVDVDASGFSGNLSATDTDVQTALDTIDAMPGGGGGESNTGSNVGASGVGTFDGKVGVDLQMRKIDGGSSKITAALNGQKVDVDVVEAQLTHDHDGATGGNAIDHANLTSKGTNTHAAIDTHLGAAAPHSGHAASVHSHTHASTTGQTADDHHPQAHALASHSDLTATGVQVDAHLGAAAPHAGHAASVHAHAATDITSGVLADARVQQSNVTQYVPYTRGTSFPGSPVDGEVCYRTDLQYEFQYFGTRAKWLGTTEYMVNFGRSGTVGVGYLRLINGMVCSATVGHYLPWAVTITGWSYAQATLVAGYYRAYLGGVYQVGAQINHANTTNSNDVQSVDIAQGVLAVYNSSGTVSNPQVFIRYRRTG